MQKLFFTSIYIFLLTPFAFSQITGRVDDLLKVVTTQKDTVQINTYIEICTEYQKFDIKKLQFYSKKVIELSKNNPNKKFEIIGYSKLGRSFYSLLQLDSSLYYYKKALLIAKNNNQKELTASIHEQLSYVYGKFEMHENAIKEILSCIAIRDSLGDKKYSGRAKARIGTILLNNKDYDNAEKYYKQALNTLQEFGNSEALSDLYSGFANLENERKNYLKSNEYLKKAIKTYDLSVNDFRPGGIYLSISNNYIYLEKYDSALFFNNIAYQYGKKYNHQELQFATISNKVTLNLRYFKNNPEAKKNLDSLLNFEELLAIPQYRIEYLQGKAAYELCSGNIEVGSRNLDDYFKLKDSISYAENIAVVQGINTKFETEKKELQIKNQSFEIDAKEKQNKQKSLIILFGALGLIATGVFGGLAFVNYKKTRKQNLIIENQKQQVELKNEEVTHQKEIVEEKQKEIIDSINYAKRIQQAVLTGEEVWNKISKEHFILFKPKDIVSGDFYWAYNTPNGRSIFALADCTGHGVPGGFMSMLGNSFLNEIVIENKIFKANEILNKLRSKVISALEQKGQTEQQKDGMDISLCVWNKMDNTLEFAGANNPLWLLRSKENGLLSGAEVPMPDIIEYKADKMPIGTYLETQQSFTSTTIQLQGNDIIYLSTDGYADQFGGPNGKKFKYKPLLEMLVANSNKPMPEQAIILEKEFNAWKVKQDQVDDVAIVGIKVLG